MSLEGVRSPGGVLYWMRCIKAFTKFVASNNRDPPVFAALVLVPTRDLYLGGIKNYEGPTMSVDEARKQAEGA